MPVLLLVKPPQRLLCRSRRVSIVTSSFPRRGIALSRLRTTRSMTVIASRRMGLLEEALVVSPPQVYRTTLYLLMRALKILQAQSSMREANTPFLKSVPETRKSLGWLGPHMRVIRNSTPPGTNATIMTTHKHYTCAWFVHRRLQQIRSLRAVRQANS